MREDQDVRECAEAGPRRPWLAGLLSLLATGVGQVYNGQWKKGVGFLLAEGLIALSMLRFWTDFAAMALCVAILFGFNLFVAGEAFATARRLREYRRKPCNRWWVYGLCLLCSLAAGSGMEQLIKARFFRAYTSPSGSMLPTLRVGDRFMVEILGQSDAPERGDIVIFAAESTGDRDFVKRVVGLPGETVEIRARLVHVDNRLLSEPYVQHTRMDSQPGRDTFGPLTLGEGEYFLLGDNREESYDSRWLGPIRRQAITGRALYVYFPADVTSDGWADRLGVGF